MGNLEDTVDGRKTDTLKIMCFEVRDLLSGVVFREESDFEVKNAPNQRTKENSFFFLKIVHTTLVEISVDT